MKPWNAAKQRQSKPQQVLHRITNRIRQSLELEEILHTTASEVRSFLKTDRVKIYRFHPDASGEVLAEAIHGDRLPSLRGLHFPAGDIPPHARALFIKSRVRVIIDLASQRKTLDQPELTKQPGMDRIRYSPVDPCHAQYLAAMGVCSSLTLPILHHDQLWGLLVSHHSQPRRFSQDDLQVVQLLVDQVSIAIAQANLLNQTRQQVQHEATINSVSYLLHSPGEVAEIRQSVLDETVKALQGSGGRLYISAQPTGQSAQLYKYGDQPTLDWLEEGRFWQQAMGNAANFTDPDLLPSRSIFTQANDRLIDPQTTPRLYTISDLYQDVQLRVLAPAFEFTSIRSILIVPLQYQQQCIGCLTIFRQEIDTETLWAGHWDRDNRNDRPRSSFAAWREVKKGLAQEWNADEIKLAQALGTHLYMAVMQRRVEEMMRHQASHDPLTGLPNRLLFDDHLSLALAQAQRQGELLAVMFLDLDRFKSINDTLGHAIGDRLLQQVADRISNCLSQSDTLARWGGDEFTLILPRIRSAEEITQIAQRILSALRSPYSAGRRNRTNSCDR